MTRETALAQFRLLFGHLQQFRGVGGFPPPIHPLVSLPCWVPPKASSDLGNIRNDNLSREKIGNQTLGGERGSETRSLESSEESCFSGSLDMGDRILEDFTLAGRTVRYNVNF